MEKKRTRRVDRMSELPESILHHILSFLPFKEVARTSVLSKRWERVWRTYPVLEFDETIFCGFWNFAPFHNLIEDAQRRRTELFNCVIETMCNRHKDMISLKKFTLSLPSLSDDREFTSFVKQCVCHAIGCNVNELKLSFRYFYGEEQWYNLPQVVLFAKSLKVLELQGCKVELPRSDLNLSSLRELTFFHVHIDDHMIKNLVRDCPLIEHLSFAQCEGFKKIELFGLPRLYEFKLVNNLEVERLDIKSSNVHSLRIARPCRTCEINLACYKNLTRLMLSAAPITDEWLHSLIAKLLVLEFLSISACVNLRIVKISSSCLKELNLCECKDANWIELKIDTPNLRSLNYWGTVTSLSLNATTLSKINLHFTCRNVDTQKYIEFLANFHHFSKALSLGIAAYENVMVPEGLRRTLSSPLSGLELFNLRFQETKTSFSIAKLVDGLLWIAPHTTTISIRNSCNCDLSFEFTYKKQLIHEGETTSFCKSHPISCWDHCIEVVNVKFTKGFNSIRYNLRGTRIWEKIVALSDGWEQLKSF